MSKLKSIKKGVDKVMDWLLIVMLAIMTVLVTYQVVTRYVFKSPSAVSEAIAQYMFVWLVMFGSALVFGDRGHLEISVLKDKMNPKPRFIVEVLINISLMIFSISVCIYGGFIGVIRQISTLDAALGISTGVIYMSIPLCGIIMVFYAIYNIFLGYEEYRDKIKNI